MEKPDIPFEPWAKIARLERDIVITEKIDGTNAGIYISEEMEVSASSRKRWILPGEDHFGFTAWVEKNAETLVQDLGAGMHFGEWWGSGVRRGYGLEKGEKRFSLFNTRKWGRYDRGDGVLEGPIFKTPGVLSVPILYEGPWVQEKVEEVKFRLLQNGSDAAPGFMRPEGIVVFHKAAQVCLKWTFDGDGHKG